MSELHFEIAAADAKAVAEREFFLTIFDLPGPADGDPNQKYAAVRPAPDAWLALTRTVHVAKRSQEDMLVASLKFLDQCFIAKDIRKALVQEIEKDPDKYAAYAPNDNDELGDDDLSDAGVELVNSNQRLSDRLMDGDDRFGTQTLVGIMESLTQQWSGNPTGSRGSSSNSQRSNGPRSTRSRSPKASISSKSSTGHRRAS